MPLTKTFIVAAAAACALTTSAHAAVTISTDPTKNENCSGGVCTPTDKTANLNVSDLQTMLAASDVTVKTGAGAISIGVGSPLTWTSAHRLTLDSIEFIHIKAAVVIEGTGALTLTTNDGGSGGDLVFENGGYVSFWDLASALVINGVNFTLVNDIKTLASDIAANPSGKYALAKSYDASVDRTYTSAPILTKFLGAFEGLGNAISNLKIVAHGRHGQDAAGGLFTESDGTLRDIALASVDISFRSGESGYAGALVVTNDRSGIVLHASVSGTISGTNDTGGLVANNAGTVSQATVNGTINSAYAGAAGLVATNIGIISQSSASGTVLSGGYGKGAGGLVGFNFGSVFQSSSDAAVTGNSAGGLVAYNLANYQSGVIDSSHASGAVTGTFGINGFAGGLAGLNTGKITNSSTSGDVDGGSGLAGGLVGSNYSEIDSQVPYIYRCRATGKVTGLIVGGLVASNRAYLSPNGRHFRYPPAIISQSYATGPVSTSYPGSQIGGLVGENIQSNIDHSYTTGTVTDTSGGTSDEIGGFAGANSSMARVSQGYSTGLITSSALPARHEIPGGFLGRDATKDGPITDYWNLDTSGIDNPHQGAGQPLDDPGITGLTDAQLKSGLPAGFDPNVWGQSASINNGWPYLLDNPPQ